MWRRILAAGVLLAALFTATADEHTHKYDSGEEVVLWMNTIGPYHNRQETYTYFSLPFCKGPETEIGHYHETMGEALQGVELEQSGYRIRFREAVTGPTEVCTTTPLTEMEVKKFWYAISNTYAAQMYMDDLPIMSLIGEFDNPDGSDTDRPVRGARFYIWSHKNFEISYNGDQIVAVTMTQDNKVEIVSGAQIKFTYSVTWLESDVLFKDRFDRYLDPNFFQHKIHWFSLMNSFMLVLFLIGVVAVILTRTLRKDFARYNKDEALDDLDRDFADEYGWKQVHADVFRAPPLTMLFSTLIGIGAHLFSCAVITLGVAMSIDMYEGRGETLTAVIFVYAGTAAVGGMVGAGLYSQLGGKNWIQQLGLQATLFPLIVCGLNFLINFVAISYASSRAIPFVTMLKISAIGIFIVLPLTLAGTLVGRATFGQPDWPCRVNPVPRQIPEHHWYLDPLAMSLMGGLLPFFSIFIEMYFVFTSFWGFKVYYVFTFLALVFLMLTMVTACVVIVCTYFLLNGEDYRWWWPSFGAGATTGVYTFIYSIYYYHFKTKMYGFFQSTFYFSYTALLCIALGLMTGAIGFCGASLFVRKIYGNVKID